MVKSSTHITNLLKHLYGIDVSQYDVSFLNKSLQKRITDTNCNSAKAYGSFMQNLILPFLRQLTFKVKLDFFSGQLAGKEI
jgi:chemotaxis methyl-accepting protein methylase